MARSSITLLALVLAWGVASNCASASVVARTRNFLGNGMQPEVVARTLAAVEQEWKAQAAVFVECSSSGAEGDGIVNCADAPDSFAKSCSTVVNAVVQGSGGDRDTTKEYMNDVCEQPTLSGWHKEGCTNLATALNDAMSSDSYENRMNFDSNGLCKEFWSNILDEEKTRAAKEKAVRDEEDRKATEEQAAEQKAFDEARTAAEVLRKKEEAAKAAEIAKAEAEEAARVLAEKKADAKAAEEEHRQLKSKAAKMQDKADEKTDVKNDKKAKAQKSVPHDTSKSTAKADASVAKKTDKK